MEKSDSVFVSNDALEADTLSWISSKDRLLYSMSL